MGHVQLRAAIATHNNSIVGKTENKSSVRFKLAVRGDTGAGGLVMPLPGRVQHTSVSTASVGLVHLYSYHSLV